MKKCGCHIKHQNHKGPLYGRPYNGKEVIVFCPLHHTAQELLDAIKDVAATCETADPYEYLDDLIKRAEGKKSK